MVCTSSVSSPRTPLECTRKGIGRQGTDSFLYGTPALRRSALSSYALTCALLIDKNPTNSGSVKSNSPEGVFTDYHRFLFCELYRFEQAVTGFYPFLFSPPDCSPPFVGLLIDTPSERLPGAQASAERRPPAPRAASLVPRFEIQTAVSSCRFNSHKFKSRVSNPPEVLPRGILV